MGENDKDVAYDVNVDTQMLIKIVIQELQDMLIEKNKSYGDSAINPIRIFSDVDPIEQINVRIDDKINRLIHGHEFVDEDTEKDLIGYLILKRVAMRRKSYEKAKRDSDFGDRNTSKLSTRGGTDKVLERNDREDLHPQQSDWLCGCKQEGGMDGKDKEHLPSVQRNVFSDIIAKP